MTLKTFPALILLVFCILLPALAQNKPAAQNPSQSQTQNQTGDEKDDVVRITTNLVQVDAVVLKDGKPVTNLTADDFELFEDGKRQTITSFAYISNVPNSEPQPVAKDMKKPATPVPFGPVRPNETRRTVAFLVDDLGLSAESIHQVKKQLRKFITEQLQPNDLVAIIRTSGEMGALQQFTNDKRILTRAVDQLRWNLCSRAGVHVLPPYQEFDNGPSMCGWRSFSISLKALHFVLDSMGYLPGRKSLVLLSDDQPRESQDEFLASPRGLPQGMGTGRNSDDGITNPADSINYYGTLQKIAEKAIRSSVVIYSVDTQGLQYTGITAADSLRGGPQAQQQIANLMSQRSMLLWRRREGGEMIARQTGGFQIRNSNSYEFKRIMDDQSGYYLIGYRPTEETFNRNFHHIKAKVKRSGMTLRTRYGFFGVTEEEAERIKRPSTQDLTNLALASPFTAQDIEVNMTAFFVDDLSGGALVRSFVYIDAKNLKFTPVNGRQQASIELHGIVFGDNGAVAHQVKRGAMLNLTDSEYQQAIANGIGLNFDMPVRKPGAYQARLAVRDRSTSKIGSAGQFVVVPDLKNKRPAASGIVLGLPGPNQTINNAGGRRFRPNDELYYAFNVYNVVNDKGQLRNLAMSAMLFRDDKVVYTGPEVPITADNQKDLSRVFINNVIKLTPDLEPGDYYLQVTVTDKDVEKKKAVPVVQWIDFQIEK